MIPLRAADTDGATWSPLPTVVALLAFLALRKRWNVILVMLLAGLALGLLTLWGSVGVSRPA